MELKAHKNGFIGENKVEVYGLDAAEWQKIVESCKGRGTVHLYCAGIPVHYRGVDAQGLPKVAPENAGELLDAMHAWDVDEAAAKRAEQARANGWNMATDLR